MILQFVHWALGPSGVKILDWLDQRGLWVPGLVLTVAVLAVVFPRSRARLMAWIVRTRERLGLAPTAEERVRLQEIRERRLGQTRGKKSRKDSEQIGKGSGA